MSLRTTGLKIAITLFVVLPVTVVVTYWISHHLWVRHHYREAQSALEDRDFRRANLHLNVCLAAWPNDPSVRILAAQSARRQGDLDRANLHLKVCRLHNGPIAQITREYELIHIHMGDAQRAENLFQLCLRNPQLPDTDVALEAIIEGDLRRLIGAFLAGANTRVDEGVQWRARVEKALDLWRQRRPGESDQAQAYFWAGRLQFVTDKAEAAAAFRKGLKHDPNHAEMRLQLAAVLAEFDPPEAVRHLEILRRQDPNDPRAAVGLASTLRSLGQLDKAQKILEEVLTANPEHLPALLERAKTALDAERPGDAEPYLRRALALSPDESFAHLALSRCLQLTGKSHDAQYHEQRYGEIEAERRRNKRLYDEQARDIWRKRVAQKQTQTPGSSDHSNNNDNK